MNTHSTQSFRPVSEESSYFTKNINKKAAEIRAEVTAEVNAQVRNEANIAIHNIVTGKDAELTTLTEAYDKLFKANEKLDKKVVSLTKEKNSFTRVQKHFVIPDEPEFIINDDKPAVEATDKEFTDILLEIIAKGSDSEVSFKDPDHEKLRHVVVMWKKFFEDYKWKSNYISYKIKKLLKDTDSIL